MKIEPAHEADKKGPSHSAGEYKTEARKYVEKIKSR